MKHIVFLIGVLAIIITGFDGNLSQANAQSTRLPEITIPDEKNEFKDNSFKPSETPNIGLRNNYLEDVIKLQYQISLLKQLLDRQKKIQQVADSYRNLGVTFESPPPPFELCRLVPVNIPCFEAYPYLYPRLRELEEREKAKRQAQAIAFKEAAKAQQQKPKSDSLPVKKVQKKTEKTATKPKPPKKKEITTDYKWADIFCIIDECKAIIIEGDDGNSRQTILEGDELLDGSKVLSITSSFVKVVKEGKNLILEPAPAVSDGGPASPLSILFESEAATPEIIPNAVEETEPRETPRGFGNSALEAQILNQFTPQIPTSSTDSVENSEDASTDVPPLIPLDDGGVGPTGLF